MTFLSKKQEEKIIESLQQMITSKLLNGFRNNRQKPVVIVDSIYIYEYKIDEENSDRDNIIIESITVRAHVWVSLNIEEGRSNDTLQLVNNKSIKFSFDEIQNDYRIVNDSEIILLDKTFF